MKEGKVSTNVYLQRVQNFALGMNWLPVPVLPRKEWPAVQYAEKRSITLEEHGDIIGAETNAERRAFYALAWHLGASQSDLAFLTAQNIDWENKVLSYERMKNGRIAFVTFGEEVEKILGELPQAGPLFPYLRSVRASDRATEFKRRCKRLGIQGVTLHSYRYAWDERATKAGMPERFAQESLGHNSVAVHRAYAKKAKVIVPALETLERAVNSDKISVMSDHIIA